MLGNSTKHSLKLRKMESTPIDIIGLKPEILRIGQHNQFSLASPGDLSKDACFFDLRGRRMHGTKQGSILVGPKRIRNTW